jgi:1-acyl-sn-glycerol-3-phosphate acyltransferase
MLDSAEWSKSSYSILSSIEKVGVNIEITGLDNVRRCEGTCVFVANHMSTFETFVLPAILLPYKDITFIVKQSLVKYPVFKHILISKEAIVVGRKNPRADLMTVLRQGGKLLSKGRSIIIFPQTTRFSVFDPAEFNTIGVKLAKRADVPVIPIALKTDAWGCGRLFKDFGRIDPRKSVHFAFGEPLYIKDNGIEEHNRIIHFIEQNLREWQV